MKDQVCTAVFFENNLLKLNAEELSILGQEEPTLSQLSELI
jgi:hypothetical protein